ncbi:MAG: RusA family crossover junction endodeoxyribonuclease [Gammaproteobacteria bacterium]|nr:RusA family crossover junction endodeoxyribonuclease [Gammaproteobacteria bacterium]
MLAEFTIIGAPVSQKNRKIIMRSAKGKLFIGSDPRVAEWKNSAVLQIRSQWGCGSPLVGPLRIDLVVYQGARQRLDGDNAIAGALDALEAAGVVANDYQFEQGSWTRRRDADDPRIEIQIWDIIRSQDRAQ